MNMYMIGVDQSCYFFVVHKGKVWESQLDSDLGWIQCKNSPWEKALHEHHRHPESQGSRPPCDSSALWFEAVRPCWWKVLCGSHRFCSAVCDDDRAGSDTDTTLCAQTGTAEDSEYMCSPSVITAINHYFHNHHCQYSLQHHNEVKFIKHSSASRNLHEAIKTKTKG